MDLPDLKAKKLAGGVPCIADEMVCSSQVIGTETVLLPIARVLDDMFWGHPVLLLFFVMIMCPLVMNVVQVRASLGL